MTPDKIQRASRLIAKLTVARVQLKDVPLAREVHIKLNHPLAEQVTRVTGPEGPYWVTLPTIKLTSKTGSELFDEVQKLVAEQLTGDIDRMERELRSLGVELPEPDFVNMEEAN